MALIEVRGLTKLYRMGDSVVRALDNVDLDIQRGEFVAITGPSGSGKSTIMHLLGCLDRPTSGRYGFDGRDVGKLSDRQLAEVRNRQIGFVFQTFNLMNRTSALDNVAVPLFYARRTATRAPARKALERVGLAQRATHRSNELSGGERQRVAVARAIVNDPLLLLADEPTGNLDSRTGQQIMDLFRTLNEQGVTVIIVTHEYDVAIQTGRIVQMHDGKIVSDRPSEEIRGEGPAHGLQSRGLAATTVPEPPPAALPVARPADALPVAIAAEEASAAATADVADLNPPRLARGATAALVVGILGLLLMVGAIVAGATAERPSQEFKPGDPVPTDLIFRALGICLGGVTAFVLGIIAIVLGWRARRWIRREPGNWRGARRALTGLILGWVVVIGPILLIAGQVVYTVLVKGKP